MKKKLSRKKLEERYQAMLYTMTTMAQVVMIDARLNMIKDPQKDFFMRFNVNALVVFFGKWATEEWEDAVLEKNINENPYVASWLKHKTETLMPLYEAEVKKLKESGNEDEDKPANFYS